jgi:acyl carrier protein
VQGRTIRQAIVDGLEAGGVGEIRRSGAREPFLAGESDVTLEELEMDSLARMELCIAIELATGVSLAPEELDRYATLVALAEDVAKRCR